MRLLAMLVTGIGLAVLVGCGRGPELGAVSGTVTYKGQPLTEGKIILYPAKGRPAEGRIENGRILDVTTLEKGDGATLGPTAIAIESQEKPIDMYKPAKWRIPQRYGNPKASGLKTDIRAGANKLELSLAD